MNTNHTFTAERQRTDQDRADLMRLGSMIGENLEAWRLIDDILARSYARVETIEVWQAAALERATEVSLLHERIDYLEAEPPDGLDSVFLAEFHHDMMQRLDSVSSALARLGAIVEDEDDSMQAAWDEDEEDVWQSMD